MNTEEIKQSINQRWLLAECGSQAMDDLIETIIDIDQRELEQEIAV